MWAPAATSGAATDDDLQPMCLDELLLQEANCQQGPKSSCELDTSEGGDVDSWAVPITGDFVGRETQPAHGDEDIYAAPMVPLESIDRGAAPPFRSLPEYAGPSRGLPGWMATPAFKCSRVFLSNTTPWCTVCSLTATNARQKRAW